MKFARQKKWLVALILLIFIGQVMASTINTCQNASLAKQNPTHAIMLQHAGHLADQSNTSLPPIFANGCDCCELECFCPMGNCISVVFSVLEHHVRADFEFEKFAQVPLSMNSPITSSLFRPPILF